MLGLFAVYAALFAAMDGLRFEPDKDEKHFWPTSLRFSESWLPHVDLLRDYGELNTPLPFIIFGSLEHLTGGGIFAGRLLNLILSFGIVALIVLRARGPLRRVIGAAIGLLLFPYFLGASCYLYTDIIAAAFAFGGFWLHLRRQHVASAVCFALAIASRQYMVAFPLAAAVHELTALRGADDRRHAGWIAPLLAASTLLGWFVFFGGPAPPGELARQGLSTAEPLRLYPQHALYFLTCVGAYYVVPELVLAPGNLTLRTVLRVRSVVVAAAMLALFIVFPPLRNPAEYPIETMGFLDKATRRVVGDHDFLRMGLFYIAALLACLRFSRLSLPALLVAVHAVLLMKGHIGWDKYALPLLVTLWFIAADQPAGASADGPACTGPSGRSSRSGP